MGRYYNGDIEGKFWFAVQSSDDADFFGSEGCEPNYLDYYFDEDHLPDIKDGLQKCDEALGEFGDKLDKFFKEGKGYNDKELAEKLEITQEKLKELLVWYARRILGRKILKCVETNKDCSFTAECLRVIVTGKQSTRS